MGDKVQRLVDAVYEEIEDGTTPEKMTVEEYKEFLRAMIDKLQIDLGAAG